MLVIELVLTSVNKYDDKGFINYLEDKNTSYVFFLSFPLRNVETVLFRM